MVNGAKNGDMNRRAFFIFARWAMCLTTPYKITKATSNDFGSTFGIVHHYKYRKRKYAPDTVEKFGVHVICAQILK